MKKLLALVLAGIMVLSLAACGGTTDTKETTAAAAEAETTAAAAEAETTAAEPTETIVWKLQTNVNAGTMVYEGAAEKFAELVKEKTNGAMEIEVYAANAIVASNEITTSVAKGVVEMGLGGPSLDTGLLNEAMLGAGMPFAFETGRQQYEFWHEYKDGEAGKILNEAYNEIGVELLQMLCFEDDYGLMTAFEVNSLDDVTSKQIRATANNGKIMNNLGVATVNVAISEVYMALSNGTADGVVMGFSTLEDFQLKEVLNYVVKPAFYSGVPSSFYVNLDAWNALSEDMQAIVRECAQEAYLEGLEPYSEEVAENLYENVIPENGLEVVELSDEDVQALMEASESVWDEIAAAGDRNKELVDMLKEFLDEKGVDYPGK